MNRLGNKIVAQNLDKTLTKNTRYSYIKIPALFFAGIFLCLSPGCVMTRAEGDAISLRMREVEGEMAKLQRVRHEVQVLLSGHMKELVDRVARLENQISNMRDVLSEGTTKSAQLLSELEVLRGQLEDAQARFMTLEQDQKSLAQSHLALKQAQKRMPIPQTKKDHFAAAKKLYTDAKFDDALYLLDEFVKLYEKDKEFIGQVYYYAGDIYHKLADNEKEQDNKNKFYKKSVVSLQKIVEMNHAASLREEALYKMGIILKALGNTEASMAAFNELLTAHKNSKRAAQAKKQLAELKAQL